MHFARSAASQEGHSQAALYILTVGFALLTAGLFLSTRNEAGWRRAVWAVALAVFAVSALHLSSGGAYDTHHERWYLEIIGHHASLPLALAILYQDYRFAFADLFLKRALALLAFVALVTGAFLLYATWFVPLAGRRWHAQRPRHRRSARPVGGDRNALPATCALDELVC